MRFLHRFAALAVCAGWAAASARAGEAIVKASGVNVRGQPTLSGEVVTQLQQGEKVVVLNEISVSQPKDAEPSRWARIEMPANTPVWVFEEFIDAAAKTVKPKLLNVRSGPGENYSVLGRLNRGEPVKPIRTVEGWMEIEAPRGTYAFVAAHFLGTSQSVMPALPMTVRTPPSAPATAPAQPAPSAQPVKTAPPSPMPADIAPDRSAPPGSKGLPSIRSLAASEASSTGTVQGSPAPRVASQTPSVSSLKIFSEAAGASPTEASPAPAQTSSADSGVSPPRRVVQRQGLVRGTVSIQAPTYYELVGPESGRVICYLHTDKVDVDLLDYKGRGIVVKGEEGVDERWPKVPVIEVETLKLVL